MRRNATGVVRRSETKRDVTHALTGRGAQRRASFRRRTLMLLLLSSQAAMGRAVSQSR